MPGRLRATASSACSFWSRRRRGSCGRGGTRASSAAEHTEAIESRVRRIELRVRRIELKGMENRAKGNARLLARRDGLVRQTLDKDALAVRGLADPIMPRCNIQPPPRNPYDAACDTPQTTLRHALRRVRPRPALLWDGRSCCPLRRHAAGHAATTPRARGSDDAGALPDVRRARDVVRPRGACGHEGQ